MSNSTGGSIGHEFTLGAKAIDRYLADSKQLGFDIVEVFGDFVCMPDNDLVGAVRQTQQTGLMSKP